MCAATNINLNLKNEITRHKAKDMINILKINEFSGDSYSTISVIPYPFFYFQRPIKRKFCLLIMLLAVPGVGFYRKIQTNWSIKVILFHFIGKGFIKRAVDKQILSLGVTPCRVVID